MGAESAGREGGGLRWQGKGTLTPLAEKGAESPGTKARGLRSPLAQRRADSGVNWQRRRQGEAKGRKRVLYVVVRGVKNEHIGNPLKILRVGLKII